MALQAIIIDKLKEFGLKLAIVETSTNGMVSSTIATYKDYEKVYKLGFILKDKSLFYKFDISSDEKFISRSTARKISKSIHDEYDCDIVLSIFSTSYDSDFNDPKNQDNHGHAYISILVVDKYEDFELQFKSEDEIRDRLLITNKALNELLYVIMKLK